MTALSWQLNGVECSFESLTTECPPCDPRHARWGLALKFIGSARNLLENAPAILSVMNDEVFHFGSMQLSDEERQKKCIWPALQDGLCRAIEDFCAPFPEVECVAFASSRPGFSYRGVLRYYAASDTCLATAEGPREALCAREQHATIMRFGEAPHLRPIEVRFPPDCWEHDGLNPDNCELVKETKTVMVVPDEGQEDKGMLTAHPCKPGAPESMRTYQEHLALKNRRTGEYGPLLSRTYGLYLHADGYLFTRNAAGEEMTPARQYEPAAGLTNGSDIVAKLSPARLQTMDTSGSCIIDRYGMNASYSLGVYRVHKTGDDGPGIEERFGCWFDVQTGGVLAAMTARRANGAIWMRDHIADIAEL